MYLPKQFAEPRLDVLHQLILAHPLSTLVTSGPSGLNANHIPLHLSPAPAPFGCLRGHVARANPLWRDSDLSVDALAIFQGPDAYVTPSWYPTKTESGKGVPTWNYAVAHAYGRLRVVDNREWLREHLAAMTAHQEARFDAPWQLEDAPADFLEQMLTAVVGIEIVISRLVGKWKTSQNQPARNQAGVVRGLRATGVASAMAMADLVEQTGRAQPGDACETPLKPSDT